MNITARRTKEKRIRPERLVACFQVDQGYRMKNRIRFFELRSRFF